MAPLTHSSFIEMTLRPFGNPSVLTSMAEPLYFYGSLEGDRDIRMPAVLGLVPKQEQAHNPKEEQLILFDQMADAMFAFASAWRQLRDRLV